MARRDPDPTIASPSATAPDDEAVDGGEATVTETASSPRRPRAGFLTVATIIGGAGNYVYGVLLTHHLTHSQYSVFAASQALLLLNGIIGGFGVSWVLAREISQRGDDPDARRAAVSYGFWANVVVGGALGAVIGGISATFAPLGVVLLLGLSTWLIAISSTVSAVMQGESRMGMLAVRGLGEIAVKVIAGVLLVTIWPTATAAMLGALIGVAVLFLGTRAVAPLIGRPVLTPHYRALWLSSFRIGRLQVGYGLLSSIDTVLVAALPIPPVSASIYQAASTLGRVPLFVSGAVSAAIYPVIVTPSERLRGRMEGLLSYTSITAYSTVALITVPSGVLGLVFPSSYLGLGHWLPYVATLGAGLGMVNLVVTFFQARTDADGAGWIIASGVVGALVASVVSEHFAGIAGLSIGVNVFAWLTAAALLAGRRERASLRAFATRHALPRLLPAIVAAVSLPFVNGTAVWLLLATVLGVWALGASFPELRVRRPRLHSR